jgi:catechol 2,3-dioxygenase-like lactoylglutathione lyase family enzyme
MLDHLTLTVRDYQRSKAFYTRVLEPLGYGVVKTFEGFCGFGPPKRPYFWIKQGKPTRPPMHLAFAAPNRKAVDAFHAAALAAGGEDWGEPGLREIYHPNYYGAFVLDLDGQPIEAVCHAPALTQRKRK